MNIDQDLVLAQIELMKDNEAQFKNTPDPIYSCDVGEGVVVRKTLTELVLQSLWLRTQTLTYLLLYLILNKAMSASLLKDPYNSNLRLRIATPNPRVKWQEGTSSRFFLGGGYGYTKATTYS